MKQSSSRAILSCLVLAIMLSTVAASPNMLQQTAKTYSWLLDMFVLSLDFTIITLLTPIWGIISFFANC